MTRVVRLKVRIQEDNFLNATKKLNSTMNEGKFNASLCAPGLSQRFIRREIAQRRAYFLAVCAEGEGLRLYDLWGVPVF